MDSPNDSNKLDRDQIERMKSAGAFTISPELFEKLYLTPKFKAPIDYHKQFANPTPLGMLGYVISVSTFSTNIMGWGGASSPAAVVGIFFFTGPLLLYTATVLEWFMGNFFAMMSFGLFSVFWLSFGMLQLPTLGLAATYSATGNAAEGAASKGYNASIALFLVVWGFVMLTYFLFTLRTNTVFAGIFFTATIGCFLLSAAYWEGSVGNYTSAAHLKTAGGAVLFVMGLLGWYMLVVLMAAEMRITVKLPVGDLSHFWPPSDVDFAEMERKN